MYLIEIFLPLSDNDGVRFTRSAYQAVNEELSERFGGVTSFPRAPAAGLWKLTDSEKREDDLVVVEVLAEKLDVEWWSDYRSRLERDFRQDKILVRAQTTQLL